MIGKLPKEYLVKGIVLMLLPVRDNPLQTRFVRPYAIMRKAGTLNYVVEIPGWKKPRQLCHVNMTKQYVRR